MKNLTTPLLLCLIGAWSLLGCNQEEPVAEPACPECEDYRAVCIAAACQCPEGYLEMWYRAALFANTIPPTLYCLAPDSLTFIANLPHNSCVDSFAIAFTSEPLAQTNLGSGPSGFYAYSYTCRDPGGRILFVTTGVISSPTKMTSWNFSFMTWTLRCSLLDFQADGQCFAESRADEDSRPSRGHFVGIFVHPDTIRGELTYFYRPDPEPRLMSLDLVRMLPY
jgi:hypothetical protein